MRTVPFNPNPPTEESRASRMDGHWMGRKVRHGAMATNLDAFMAMIEYDGDDPSDGHASPFNPVYRRAKPSARAEPFVRAARDTSDRAGQAQRPRG